MATISKLVVALSANSAKLVSDLRKSKRSVGKWAADLRTKANAVGKAMGIAAGAAGAAIVAIVNRQAAQIDRLAKKAATLRIDTSTLERLRYQAELTGVSADLMDKSMTRMLKTISDANNGLSTAKRAFDDLGLSAERLAGMTPDQQFAAIAQAMGGIESQAERTRIAMDIFGRTGSDLLNTLSSDLAASGAEFDALGGSITSQQSAMVEAYNDSKTKLATIWNGFLNQITVRVAPAFQAVIEWVTQTVTAFGGMGKVASQVVSGIATGIGFVTDVLHGWRMLIKVVQIAWSHMAETALKALGVVYDKYADLRELLDDDFERTDFFDGMADSFAHQRSLVEFQLNELISQERPSIQLKAKIAEIEGAVAAAGVGNIKQPDISTAGLGAGGGPDAAGGIGEMGDEIERVRRQLLTEEEAIRESYQRRAQIILDNTTETSAARSDLWVRNTQRMQDELAQLEQRRLEERLGHARNFFGSLAQLSSSSNKKLARIGQAAAIAQATIDGILGVQKALASAPPPINFALAAAVGTAAAANVAQIRGMAHDGIDSIPKEGTWLLDKGERVVDRRTNADLKDYLARGGNGGGSAPVINIHNYSGKPVETSQNDGAIDVVIGRVSDDIQRGTGIARTFESVYGLRRQGAI